MPDRNWNDPREREEYERQRLQSERKLRETNGGGSWFGWWWIWVVFIIFVFVWFAGWGWWGYGGWWGWRNRPVAEAPYNGGAYNGNRAGTSMNGAVNSGAATNNAANPGEVASVPELLSNPHAYDGHNVVIPATVQRVVNSHAALIGPNGKRELAVTLPPNTNVRQGEQVKISATVQRPPSANQLRQNLGLDSNEVRQVEDTGVYLQASSVVPESVNNQNDQSGNGNQNR